jgi:uncharacterized protein YjbI with pentapeptide repeats/DNA-binding Xre family transcriptional regulator
MSRSLRVRADLVPQIELAVKRNGFLRKKDLAEDLKMAESTVRKFRKGKPVDNAIFVEICQKLHLEWQEFAELGEITELHRESEEAVIAQYSTSATEKTTPDTLDLVERKEVITKPHIQIEESNTNLIEERIFRATEQLNRRGLSALVGIQALEEIAKDSPRYHWKIMELLAAFVRNAPRRKEEEGIPDNIQAALTIIVRRDWNLPIQTLDLSNTDLRGANLNGANLQGVKLDGANLQEVTLIAANLQKATLKSANLQRAIMHKANLKRANFTEADLQEADLDMTDLEGAELWNTNLQGTRLRAAYLQKAKLIQVNLQGAFIWDSDWRGVILSGVNLRGADFKRRAKNLESRELEDTYGDSKAASSLPENVKAPEHWMQST